MKKRETILTGYKFPLLKKIMKIMKLTTFLLLTTTMLVSASVYSQSTRLTLKFTDITYWELFHEIEKQSEFRFAFSRSKLDPSAKIQINAMDETLEQILNKALPIGIAYEIIDRYVVILNASEKIMLPESQRMQLQQQQTVSGKVTDSNNQPLPGVTIVVKGTTQGTVSNDQGEFSLINIPDNAELVFSFVGMQTQNIFVGTKTIINITMQQDIIGLEEVVAVGYGTVKRSDLTGSVSRISSERIRDMSLTQMTETLSGTVAGLYSQQATSASGGGSLEIRGPSSLSAHTDPLVVIDGVIYYGSIRDINPNDVESIDILKDASSSAIYGSKAASGVIIITTKTGQIGKPTINFSAKLGVSSTTNDLKPYGMDNPKEYFNAHRDYQRQRNPDQPDYYYFHPDDLPESIGLDEWMNYSANPADDPIDEWANRLVLWPIEYENYKLGKTTDFYNIVIRPDLRQDYSLSVGGAREDMQYYWSIGYLDNKGIIKGDQFSAIRSRINFDLNVTEWLTVGTNTHFSSRDESVIQANMSHLASMSPYGSMWNEDGSLRRYPNDYTLIRNPLENYYGADRLRNINSLFSSLHAQLELPFGISYRISFQPRIQTLKDYVFYSSETHTGRVTYVGGRGERQDQSEFEWMLDNLIKWNKEIGKHNFDLTLLASAEQQKSWQSDQNNVNFSPNEKLSYHGLQFGTNPGISNYDSESTGDALMARLNYTYKGKYLFTGSIRRDGYSAFGQKNPHATFPAIAIAWKMDEESFYNISWMNHLKLRLSWGINGNRDIGPYSALARLGSIESYSLSGYGIGVYSTTLANSYLAWEETEAFNIGFDLGMINNRIDITVDAYKGTTRNLLLNRQLPRITGFSSITSNLGKLGNKGIEATINSFNVDDKNFDWRTSLVFSLNRNKIEELWGDFGNYKLLGEDRYGELPDFENEWFPGYARDIIWNYKVTGIWQLDEMEQAANYGMKPGDFKSVDVNEDGEYTQLEDKKFIGYTAPRYRLGLKNDFSFLQNFSASIFIRADIGHLRSMSILTPEMSTFGIRNAWGIPYWSPEHPTNDFPRLVWPSTLSQYGGGITAYKPTGFVRVQDVSVSYDLPSAAAQKIQVNSIRVSAIIRNLFTFTNYPGFDPESGMDPMPKTFTLGIDLTL